MGMIATLREIQSGDVERMHDIGEVVTMFNDDDPATLSLEKAWGGLEELLTTAGTAPELGFMSSAGRDVGIALSYGPPRLLPADFVRRLDIALQAIDDDQLWAGFDATRFEEEGIYPGIWDEPADELREEYVGYFRDLKAFVGRVAAAGGEVAVVIL